MAKLQEKLEAATVHAQQAEIASTEAASVQADENAQGSLLKVQQLTEELQLLREASQQRDEFLAEMARLRGALFVAEQAAELAAARQRELEEAATKATVEATVAEPEHDAECRAPGLADSLPRPQRCSFLRIALVAFVMLVAGAFYGHQRLAPLAAPAAVGMEMQALHFKAGPVSSEEAAALDDLARQEVLHTPQAALVTEKEPLMSTESNEDEGHHEALVDMLPSQADSSTEVATQPVAPGSTVKNSLVVVLTAFITYLKYLA
jgi:hypothetical protein